MLGIIIGVLFSLVIAVGLAMISLAGCRLIAFWSLLIIFLLGVLALLFIAIWYFQFSNRKWKFQTSDIPNLDGKYYEAIKKSPWRSLNPQGEGMFYRIDFGREQNITGVQFDHGYSFETPSKWRMWFFDKTAGHVFPYGHRHPYIETGDLETRQNTSAIIVELRQPIRARHIKVEILEPEVRKGITEYWRIEAVYIRVKAIFGFKHTIGKFCLDKL